MRCALLFCLLTQLCFSQNASNGEAVFQKKCIECHGADAKGLKEKEAPRLAGQYDWYIVSSLKKFISGERVNEVMMPFLKGLTENDYKDIAAYLSGLK